jgi:uncharacterized protein (TIGR00730 family)
MLKQICVFCGSNYGKSDLYKREVIQLGDLLGEKKITLVYGGGNAGLMGELARTVISHDGTVIGVIPQLIHDKIDKLTLSELFVVDHMHERKAKMYDLSDGFIALPGGIGTLEELAEVLTWQQIGYHQKPVGILNINRFYDKLIDCLYHMHDENFLRKEFFDNLIISEDPIDLIKKMENFTYVAASKWDLK